MASKNDVTLLVPPDVFGVVEPGVYRSNSLSAKNYPYVKALNLKTVVYLSSELPTRVLSTFFEECGVILKHLGGKAWSDQAWKPVSEEVVKEALEAILNSQTHPLMLMCTSGIHVTGTVVGCLRRIQHWNLTAILDEYRLFAGNKARYVNEQFIELFDCDLVTFPDTLPLWFQEQEQMLEVEQQEIRVYLEQSKQLGQPAVMSHRVNYCRADLPLKSANVKIDEKKSLVLDDDD